MFRVELRDRSFDVLEILDREYMDLYWAYSRVGGCGEFNFSLPRKLYEEGAISGDFNVRLYYRNPDTKNFDLWYQGFIQNKVLNVDGSRETVEISGHGYQAQLSRIYLSRTYNSTEVSAIVTNILDNYVTPNTDVSYNAVDIETTPFTPTTLKFEGTVLDALQKCADIVGSREWGVDKDRNFFFKARSESVELYYKVGNNIINFSDDVDFENIANRLNIQGAEAGGTYYSATYDELTSQLKYNLRTKVIQNSSINTDDVAAQYATAVFAEFATPTRRANGTLVDFNARIEATNPIPLASIRGKDATYGTKKFGTGLYSGQVSRQINRISYNLSNNNALKVQIDFGHLRPTLAEQISQLEYELEQQRTSAL